MTFLHKRDANSDLKTDGHAPRRTRTGRDRTEAPSHHRFAHPPVHWPRPAAPPPLFRRSMLPYAAGCHLGPTPTHCEGRLWTKPFSKPLRAGFSFKKLHQAPFTLYEPMWKMVKASYLHCIIILFYMSYLRMVNRTCSKPKLLKEAVFSSPTWRNFIKIPFNYKMWILPLQKTCNLICILNAGCHQVKPTTKRQGQRSKGTLQLRPPRRPCFAPLATPPPPGASLPPRGLP